MGDVHYAELMLGGGAASPQHQEKQRGGAPLYDPPPGSSKSHQHDPEGVIYATLDHERGQGCHPTTTHLHHHHHLHHTAYTQPVLVPHTPTHACNIPGTGVTGPPKCKELQYPVWSPSSTSIERCDALIGDPEAIVPFLPGQKESSV